jgi:hypothetical protein
MQYSEKELDRIFKKMMRNVRLSSNTKGSNRKSAQEVINKTTLKRELKVSENNVVYREHKEHKVDVDYKYLKELWLQQDKKDYWFPNYKIELHEIFVPYSIKAPSVDRLNSTEGYIKGNVVITTRFANLGRGNFSGDDFREFTKKLFNL